MGIRQKTIWVVGAIFSAQIAGIYLLSSAFLIESYTTLIWVTLVGGAVSGVLILVFLEKTILSRVTQLNRDVKRIEGRQGLGRRVGVVGKDELSSLAETINRTLGELEHTEQELIRLERVRALGEMAAGINHNLNNILVGVVISADLLREESEDPQVLKRVEMIRGCAAQAQGLVARLQRAVQSDEEETQGIQVNSVIQEAVTAGRLKWKDEAEARGVGIQVYLDLDENIYLLKGTVTGLYNIILNLLFNAVDALPDGGDITVITRQLEDGALISVRDNGVGMDETVQKRIFEPFFTTKLEIGTGLGLSTVYNTLVRWGAKIDVDSQPGKGTEFTLWLPVESRVGTNLEGTLEIPEVRSGHILVVDDQEPVGIMVEDILRRTHQVTRVASGKEALEHFAREGSDVAIIDLGMPGIPGDQVAQELRRLDPGVVTILMTGWHLEPNDPRLSLFDFHLRKPLKNLDEVRYIVAKAIQQRDESISASMTS